VVDPQSLAGELAAGAVGGTEFAVSWISIPAEDWLVAGQRLHGDFGFDYFDWLTGYASAQGVAVAAHLFSITGRTRLLLRTVAPGDPPVLASLTSVWRGADWHERETAEMFGVVFSGHPDPRPLLLADGFSGHPLRKDFQLTARQRPWPGAEDPDPRRRRLRPPGAQQP
jgi:NADH-quinone oxidoreductase subunit C